MLFWFQQWHKASSGNKVSLADKPYLQSLLAFCHHKTDAMKVERSVAFKKRAPGPTEDSFEYVSTYLTSGVLTQFLYKTRCLAMVEKSIASFTSELELSTFTGAGVCLKFATGLASCLQEGT